MRGDIRMQGPGPHPLAALHTPSCDSLSLLLSVCFLPTSASSFSSSHKQKVREGKWSLIYSFRFSAWVFLPSSSSSWFPFLTKSEVIYHSFKPQNQETLFFLHTGTSHLSQLRSLPQEGLQAGAQWWGHSAFSHLEVLFTGHQIHLSKQQNRSSHSLAWRSSGVPRNIQNAAQDP